jgi:hypothetical protein
MSTIIPLQAELRPQLPTVEGNVDYRTFRQQLERIDQLLAQTGLETDFVAASLRHWESQACASPIPGCRSAGCGVPRRPRLNAGRNSPVCAQRKIRFHLPASRDS